jgi:hypothetical protein
MPDLHVVDLSRLQFAITALYHFLFVPLTIGLALLMAIMESVYVMTGREIWKQMVAMDRNLSARIDQTNATLAAFKQQTHENFGRVQRNFERIEERLEHGTTRVDEIEARLTRVETHVGLREP